MKIIIAPTFSNPRKLRQLKKVLRRNGIDTTIETPEVGNLGRGVFSGLAAIFTGGEGFFSKIGEAIVKYVELKKVDVTMKNGEGEEITISAALPKEEVLSMVNRFFNKKNSRKKTTHSPKTRAEILKRKTAEEKAVIS